MKQRLSKKAYAVVAAMTAAAFLPTASEAKLSQICGVVSYPSQAAGAYTFGLESYAPTLIKRNVYASGGGIAVDGEYYSVRYENIMGLPVVQELCYSLPDFELTDEYTGDLSNVATAMAYNYNTDRTYACYITADGQGYVLAIANVRYWSPKTVICPLEEPFSAMAFASDGQLYAIDFDGRLFTVDTATGATTLVGETGLVSEQITGGFIDPDDNTFYWSVKSETQAAIYKVNITDATATLLYNLENEEQLGGFYMPEVFADKVPGKPAGSVSLSFSGTSLSGRVQFRPPTTTYDGVKAEGDLTYRVYANGNEIANGTTSYGAGYQNVDVTLDNPGWYCISVVHENAEGKSPRGKQAKFIGPDTPKAPSSVSVSYADGVATVRWGSVTSGANDGSIDTSTRRYVVTRHPDNVVVSADNQTTTSLTDNIPMPQERTTYHYTVKAVAGGYEGAEAKSTEFSLGPVVPAFNLGFQATTDLIGWTVPAPASGAGGKWEFSSSDKAMRVRTSGKPTDSWLISPPVRLKKGEAYEVSALLRSYNTSYTETFEICAGTSAEPAALTSVIVPDGSVSSATPVKFSGTFKPQADGIYYIGVRATSNNCGYLYLTELSAGEGVSLTAPAVVQNLAVTADASGAHIVTASFTLPTLTIQGEPLAEITRMELLRDGAVVKTKSEALTPGTAATITDDTDVPAGTHTYTVICYGEGDSKGESASADVFVGYSAPVAPTAITVKETGNLGEVTVTWNAPATDTEGRLLTAEALSYTLLDKTGAVVKEGIKGTTETFRALDETDHNFVQYLVKAVTEGGESALCKSALVPVGTPCATPWKESFAGRAVSSPIGTAKVEGDEAWMIISADNDNGINPADNDGGMAYLEGYSNTKSALFTGKIDLAALPSPALTFYVYNYMTNDPNINTIEVQVSNGDGFATLQTVVIADTGEENQWNKVILPLDDYAGQVVQVKFIASVEKYRFFWLDDINITSVTGYNLAARGLQAPAAVDRAKPYTVAAIVENTGLNRVQNYSVNLIADDVVVDSRRGAALEPNEIGTVEFECNSDALTPEKVTYTAEIDYGNDEIAGDNTSSPVSVFVKRSGLPAVDDLTVSGADNTATLAWSTPSAEGAATAEQTEDLESATGWSSEVDGWTLLDLDKGSIGGIGNKQLPVSGQQPFFVMDDQHAAFFNSDGTYNNAFKAHSGNRHLCSMYSMRGSTPLKSDDWAISPELYGGAQTVKLFASSFLSDADQPQYNESFEILYSTTGRNPEDFTMLARFEDIPAAWIEYSAYLPEGAKYFAIRGVSYDKYMLFIDDIRFCPLNGKAAEVTLKGYNIYRDGVKISPATVSANTFADSGLDVGSTHRYVVTALYDEGESNPSNEVEVTLTSGISAATSSGITVTGGQGEITVEGVEAMQVAVVAADGRLHAAVTGAQRTVIPAAAGIYVVIAGDRAVKVSVK